MGITLSKRRQHWEPVVKAWGDSGQSIVDFCKDNNLAVATFHYWKKKFADEQLPVAGFKELITPVTDGAGLWFDFGNGAKLVIDNEFNEHTFKKLMGVLSGC